MIPLRPEAVLLVEDDVMVRWRRGALRSSCLLCSWSLSFPNQHQAQAHRGEGMRATGPGADFQSSLMPT